MDSEKERKKKNLALVNKVPRNGLAEGSYMRTFSRNGLTQGPYMVLLPEISGP